MVMEGTRNKNSHGERKNKGLNVAYPFSGILSCPGNNHRKKPLTNKNTMITI